MPIRHLCRHGMLGFRRENEQGNVPGRRHVRREEVNRGEGANVDGCARHGDPQAPQLPGRGARRAP